MKGTHMSRPNPRKRGGFTLIEMLVVIAIIGVLIGLLLPAIQAARESASRTKCQSNMRQCGIAANTAYDQYKKLPMAVQPTGTTYAGLAGPNTCFFYLLPFIEQQDIQAQPAAAAFPVVVWRCPSDPTNSTTINPTTGLATSNYAANWAAFGGASLNRRPDSYLDGTSRTTLFSERLAIDPSAGAFSNTWGYAGLTNTTPPYGIPSAGSPFIGYFAMGTSYATAEAAAASPPSGYASDLNFVTAQYLSVASQFPASASCAHKGTINVCMGDASVQTVAQQYSGMVISATNANGGWFSALTPDCSPADYYSFSD
jgi:prepilin-type N-terminal cleavage/methylation domain-containing protein